jgi:hypothetical protein
MTKPSIFRQAIDDGHGSVNVGYLALYWTIAVWSLMSVGILLSGAHAVASAKSTELSSVIQAIGVAEGALASGFALVVGAIGAFLWGDSRTPLHAPAPQTTVTVNQ